MKVLIGIISFVLWSLVSIQWYVCGIKGLCDGDNVEASDTDKISQTTVSEDETNSDSVATANFVDTVSAKTPEPEETAVAAIDSVPKFSLERSEIYFPFAKTSAHMNKSQKDSFRRLAKEINASNATLTLIGHADTVGTNQKNSEIGLLRAEWMKKMFVSFGLDADRIITKSKGEGAVVSNNSGGLDMQSSRRVDIIVNK